MESAKWQRVDNPGIIPRLHITLVYRRLFHGTWSNSYNSQRF